MHDMVDPIILLAKRNIDFNAQKNERFLEGKKAYENLTQEIAYLRSEVSHLPYLRDKLKAIEEDTQMQFVYYKGRVEG